MDEKQYIIGISKVRGSKVRKPFLFLVKTDSSSTTWMHEKSKALIWNDIELAKKCANEERFSSGYSDCRFHILYA